MTRADERASSAGDVMSGKRRRQSWEPSWWLTVSTVLRQEMSNRTVYSFVCFDLQSLEWLYGVIAAAAAAAAGKDDEDGG